MNVLLLCVGLLGFLVILLGQLVSGVRIGVMKSSEEAFKVRVRAHGNAAEYVPTLSLLTLCCGHVWGAPTWVQALAITAVVGRYSHAVGMYAAGVVERKHPLKFIGATLTYVVGIALAVALVVGVATHWSALG